MKNPMRNSQKITDLTDLYSELGHSTLMAEMSGLKKSALVNWKHRGKIPPKAWPVFQNLALNKEIILTGDDYFRLHGIEIITEFR